MSNKKKLAIVGLGVQSRDELIPMLLKLADRCEIVSICDINEEFIRLTKEIIPHANQLTVHKDYQQLFADIGNKNGLHLDGVILSIPHFLYSDTVELAITKGVPVFKEKPFALNLTEAKKLSTLAIKEGVQIYTVTKRQFYKSYSKGRQLLTDGVIGTPYMYSARHFIPHGNLYTGWRSINQSAGGGVLIDMGYHLLDVILRYFGDISQVNLHWSNIAKQNYTYEVEDAASLHTWHPSGIHGVFQLAAINGPKEETIEVRGTKGRMTVTNNETTIYNIAGNTIDSYVHKPDSLTAVATAFKQFLQNDKTIWSQNISHNIKIMKVIDMAYKNKDL